MNINKITSIGSKNIHPLNTGSYSSIPYYLTKNQAYDSVNFSGNGIVKKRVAPFISAAILAVNPFITGSAEKNIADFRNLQPVEVEELDDDNNFQLAQRLDSPSLTFDLTGNWEPRTISPKDSYATLSQIDNGNSYTSPWSVTMPIATPNYLKKLRKDKLIMQTEMLQTLLRN